MANVKISNFIVLDRDLSLKDLRMSSRMYRYTDGGTIIYPIGTPVPIIKKGMGCIGFATIDKMVVTATSTEAYFEYSEINNKQMADAYYQLYRGTVTMGASASDDIYGGDDVIIPGVVTAPAQGPKADRHNRRAMDEVNEIEKIFSKLNSNQDKYPLAGLDEDDYDF